MDTGETPTRTPAYLCLECFRDVALSDCQLVHLNDGLPAHSGHWRKGHLCGPVVQPDQDTTCDWVEDFVERWKPPRVS